MHKVRVLTLTSVVALAFAAHASTTHAQSRPFDVRLSLGVAPPPLTGLLQQSPVHYGLVGSLAFEYRVVRPLALELQLATAYFPVDVSMSPNLPSFAMDASAQAGVRVYPISGLFIAARGGVHSFLQELRGGAEVELGWDFSPVPAFTVGPFARSTIIVGTTPERPTEAFLVFGITLALGPVRPESATQHVDEPPPSTQNPNGGSGQYNTTSPSQNVATPIAAEDGDRDGVPDDRDRCPGSPLGATGIGSDGCTGNSGSAAQTNGNGTSHRHRHGRRRHHR